MLMRTQLTFCLLLFSISVSTGNAEEIDFNRDIRPILSDKCIGCHGPDEEARQAELRLDVEESAFEDRGGYAAIKPGDPANSELISRIESEEEFLRMPPVDSEKSLTEQEIQTLRTWIKQGAEWQPHWAYVKPGKTPTPDVENKDWCNNFIDNYILRRLEKKGLTPAPDADRTTLLRRLSFDLTGLPPTPELTERSLSNDSSVAKETLIDQLLASPHYGERMAIQWLDLVRYADTVGYHGDQTHNASPYRDWVIHAFNENLPYDEFTRAQLAGDLMENRTEDQLIASAYNRLLQTSHEGGVQKKEYLAIYAADHVRNLSQVWMGATMGCCQCHSHKYDPYTIEDFYSMAAFFADLDEARHIGNGTNDLPTRREPEIEVLTPQQRERLAHLREEKAAKTNKLDSLKEKKADQKERLTQQLHELDEQIKEIEDAKQVVMISKSKEPRVMRVLPRGNWLDDSGAIVEPDVPDFLGEARHEGDRATRLDLANWLVDPHEGTGLLTARVYVNRLWSLMFGRGLADLSDFGGQGSPPTHAELLDRLAIEFVESGWDIKHMMRLMAQSHTYQQSSVASPELEKLDPENALYARQSRFRLPAEMIRDNALAVSGLLVEEIGGPSTRPYQPEGYYRHLNFPKRTYSEDRNRQQWRRGVYVHWQRQFLHPMLKAFDAPTREECTAQRPRSNTPLAALTLLNDPTFIEAARFLAQRILLEEIDSDTKRFDQAGKLVMNRPLDAREEKILRDVLAKQRIYYEKNPKAAQQLLSVGLAKHNEKINEQELAAWTQVARVLLNLSEVTTRN